MHTRALAAVKGNALMAILVHAIVAPWYIPIMINDFNHPELWDLDRAHDPRLYLPLLIALEVAMVGFFLYSWRVGVRLDALTDLLHYSSRKR